MDHLSSTAIDMLSRCARQFWYRYIEGYKIPPSAAQNFGSSYHVTLEENFRYKITSGDDIPPESAKAIFSDDWDTRSKEVDWVYEEDDPGNLKDMGVRLVEIYVLEKSPQRQPEAAEQRFEIALPGVDRLFVGVIDLIDQRGFLVDHKTSSRSWNQNRADTAQQATAYMIAFMELYNKSPKEFVYDVAVKTARPKVDSLITRRSQQQIDEYLERVRDAEALIAAEVYPKTDPSNWYCNPRYCGYYDHCMRGIPLNRLRLLENERDIEDEIASVI